MRRSVLLLAVAALVAACPPPRAPPATAATSPAATRPPAPDPGAGGRHRRRAGGPERRRRAGRQGRRPSSRRVPWGGTAGQPAGYRLEYRWAAALAADVDQEWPLLRSDAATPEPPYDSTLYRDQGERRDRPAGRRPPRRRPGHPGHAAGRRDGVRARGADLAAVQLGPVVHAPIRGSSRPVFIALVDPVHGARLAALARLEPAPAVHDAPRPPVHRPRRRAAVPAGRVRLAVLRGLVRGDGAVGRTPAPRRPARSPRCRCCSSRRGSSSPASSSS